MTAREWLAKRAELEQAATEGPWIWEPPSHEDWPNADESLVTETGDAVLMGWGYDASGIEGEPADRAFIADARTAAPAMRKALEAVLEIHHLIEGRPDCGNGCCGVIEDECAECRYWPCYTVTAITTALGVES